MVSFKVAFRSYGASRAGFDFRCYAMLVFDDLI